MKVEHLAGVCLQTGFSKHDFFFWDFCSCSWLQMTSDTSHLSIESDSFKEQHIYFTHTADPMYLKHSTCSLQISYKTSA